MMEYEPTQPKIDVRIPYEPGGLLGWDYNRIMHESAYEWVLFLDHDVLLLHPNWYVICQHVIQKNDAALYTCKTNADHPTEQRDLRAPRRNNIKAHMKRARKLWNENAFKCIPIQHASGFFMLVNKPAWKAVNGFPGNKMFEEDWGFSDRLRKSGYKILCMQGLYVYHMRMRTGTWMEKEYTAKEFLEAGL